MDLGRRVTPRVVWPAAADALVAVRREVPTAKGWWWVLGGRGRRSGVGAGAAGVKKLAGAVAFLEEAKGGGGARLERHMLCRAL